MSRHKVEICGVNTANIKVLSNEEMIQLFQKFHQGDLSAKEQLIQGNLKLVLSILKKLSRYALCEVRNVPLVNKESK